MTYEEIYNQSQGGSPLLARLCVAVTVWALSVSLLPAEDATRPKKVAVGQSVVEEPQRAARRLLLFVLVNQMLSGKDGEVSDAELQAIANKLMDAYAVETPDKAVN